MTDPHVPLDGPEEPAEAPDGRASASIPGMPADPFTPADTGYALIMGSFRGLRKAGAGLMEAALITAAHVVISGISNEARKPPEHS
jgi:hypothetical protein